MNSILTPMTGIKALVIAAVCSAPLTACFYTQPNSQVLVSDQQKTTPLQTATPSRVAGSYALIQKPEATEVIVEISQASVTSPAKLIQIELNSQQQPLKGQKMNSHPANCQYKATATLMGQDALHGVIYTAPVSGIDTEDKDLSIENNQGLLFFRFKDNVLSIDSNNPEALSSLCENSIQLKGDYAKLK